LHQDLIAMLRATRAAERAIFAMLDEGSRATPGALGSWSAKDVQAHLAAWRSIEARRLAAAAGGEPSTGDPAPNDPIDASNAALQAQHAGWSWAAVDREADGSIAALIAAIESSSTEALCVCTDDVAGIGANGVNHAIAHLGDVARLAGAAAPFDELARQIEAILRRSHLLPRDSGVILYNLACDRAVSGQLDEARRLLRMAFRLRHDLLEPARDDPDLSALTVELSSLAGAD
jgi:hypothetical protein